MNRNVWQNLPCSPSSLAVSLPLANGSETHPSTDCCSAEQCRPLKRT